MYIYVIYRLYCITNALLYRLIEIWIQEGIAGAWKENSKAFSRRCLGMTG